MERKRRERRRRAEPRPVRSEDALDNSGIKPIEGNDGGQDWAAAEHSRPDLPDETEDGLDPLEESVRHAAEDIPLGPIGENGPALPYVGETEEEAAEALETIENEGDMPGLTDQGEETDETDEGRKNEGRK